MKPAVSLSRSAGQPTQARRKSRKQWTLRFEQLEDRVLLATNVWQGGAAGNWNTIANWSDGIPTSDDDVVVDELGLETVAITMNSGANVAATITMSGDDSLSIFNSSLTLGGGAASAISNLALTGSGTVSTFGDLTLTGTSSMANSAVLTGNGTIFNTGTLNMGGGPEIRTELENTGTMNMNAVTAVVRGAAAKVRVFGGGVLNLTNAALQRPDGGLGVFIEDDGTANSVTGNSTANGALFVDGGNVNVTGVPGNSLTFNVGTSLHNATFNVAANTFVVFNGSLQQTAVSGTFTAKGAGQVVINGDNSFVLANDTVFDFAQSVLQFQNSAAIEGPGTLTNAGFVQGSPVLKTKVLNTGTFASTGTLTFSGANAELRILAGGTIGSAGINLAGDASSQGLFVETGGQLIGSFATGTTVPVQILGGTVKTAGSSVQFSGPTTLVNPLFDTTAGGTVFFQAGSNVTASGVLTGSGPAGTVFFGNGASTLNIPAGGAIFDFPDGLATFSAATITGPGTLTNTGDINGGPIIATKVVNTGTFTPTSSLTFSGANAELRILAGSKFESAGVNFIGSAASKGLFVESGGQLVALGGINTGAVPVQVLGGTVKTGPGSVQFFGTASLVGAHFDTTGGGQVFFQNGSVTTFSGTTTGTGPASTVTFANGSSVNVPAGGATLDFGPGLAVFNNATINGPGVLISVGELRFSPSDLVLRTELRIEGNLNLIGANPNFRLDGPDGLLRIADGGRYVGSSNVDGHGIGATNGGAGIRIEPGGVFQSTGILTVTAPFDNRGTVVVDNRLRLNGAIAQISGPLASAALTGGTWIVNPSGAIFFTKISLVALGASANVRVSGALFSFDALTSLASNAGTLELFGGRDLLTTATFTNTGDIVLGAGSELTVGTFTQTAAGSVEFGIAGTAATQLGKLTGTAAATLAGTARVSVVGGFDPQAGQSFPLMSFTSRTGTFAKVEGLNIGHADVFEPVYTATTFSLSSLVNAADLDVETVTPPGASVAGQDVSFSYTVRNVGTFDTPVGLWTDTIYLSLDDQLDSRDIVLASRVHNGVVAANGTYTDNVTVPLVGALPDGYRLIVVADARGFAADTDRANNTLASTTTFALDIPLLTPGLPQLGTIRNVQDLYFRVALPAGQTPTFTFTGAVAGEAELYVSLGDVPTRATFDERAFALGSTVQRVAGDATAAATYFILLHGRENAGAGQTFSLLADGIGFDLAASSVTSGANIGRATTMLTGSQFSPATTFALVPATGPSRAAMATYFHDSQSMDATFDLTGLAAGSYSIVADNGGPTDMLADAFTVTSGGTPGTLRFSLSSPRAVRPPFIGTAATITFENVGQTDLDAPLFHLTAENARLRLADEPGFVAGTFTQTNGRALGVFELLGTSGGRAGVLSPGEKAKIDVFFEPIDATAHAFSNFEILSVADGSAAIDFSSLKDELRPVGVSAEAWNAVFANFQASVGSTINSYKAMLVDNANYLGQFGSVSPAVTRLVDFELDQAGAFGAIVERNELGAFGRGSTSPFGDRLTVGPSGDVTIKDGSHERIFVRLGDGSYDGTGVDFGTLTRNGAGVFTLNEKSGTTTVFRPSDGRIDFVEDPNGARLTAGWNASGQLVSVTDSLTGEDATFTYNAQGRIASATDAVGRVSTYGYDASGEHLLNVTDALGTTTFEYVTGQGAAREHALASVTGPDGVKISSTYDAQGRLIQRTVGAGPQAVALSYAYDSAGKVTTTDTAAHVTQNFFVGPGAIARTIDALGQTTSLRFDSLGRIVSATDASGVKTTTSFDSAGVFNGVVDADRSRTQLDFGGDILRLQSVTDPGGDVTRYRYDTKGNLLETIYPDGFASQSEYDSAGRVVATTDANGARATYAYNAAGLITLRTNADGSTVAYAYDAHRNLLTATDGEGTTAMTYDAADRLLTIAYPNGKTITNTYDAAGRRATVADQTGYTVRYSYDALGRLDVVRDTANALLVDYDYDALGQLILETRGNGSSSAYTYDALGRTSTITHRDASNAVIGFFNYTYDSHDRIKTVTDATGTTTYTYDLAGQLVGAALPSGRTISYGYDAEGNRVTVADSANGTDNYATNNADQYTAAGGETLTYDRAGRVVASTVGGVTTSYSYAAAGRLIGITSLGSVITFDYDALGNRIGKTENGVRIDFAIDFAGLGNVFGEYQGASTTAHYASGFGVTARADGAGAPAFYHYDATGNTALLSGAGGASVASYTYLPFGEIAAQTGASAQPFTFGGRDGVLDDAGDLYHMRAREYDAGLGRFTARDPIGFGSGDTNLYRFALNDPVNLNDPSGLSFGPLQIPGVIRIFPEAAFEAFSPLIEAAVANPGVNLPAVYDKAFALSQLQNFASSGGAVAQASGDATGLYVRGSESAIKNFGTPLQKAAQKFPYLKPLVPVAKFLSPLAKYAPPISIALDTLYLAKKYKDATDYYKDASVYGKFNPDELNFPPEYYRDNGDNWLFTQLVRDGIASGKSKQDATLMAIQFLKKNGIYDPMFNPNPRSPSEVIRPFDPNNIVGPAGAGADEVPDIIAPGQVRFDGFVAAGANYPYKIEFENQPTASAPAQVVHVTQMLDDDLDLSTFAFTGFGFGAFVVSMPPGAIGSSFSTIVDATAALGVLVQIDATLDTQTGLLDVTFTSLDPATNDVPLDPFAGFLPPDDGTGRGDGFLTYSVAQNPGLANDTDFTALASIVFDTEAAIATPTVTNTLDTVAPTSSITALPVTTFATAGRFTVSWSGRDDTAGPAGSGIALFDVFISDNGGPITPFLEQTAATSGIFTGEFGHTYGFFSVATDNVGLRQSTPAGAQTTTTVEDPGPHIIDARLTPSAAGKTIGSLILTFDEALTESTAENPASYLLQLAGKDKRFGTSDDATVPATADYDAALLTVTLTPQSAKPLKLNQFLRLTAPGTAGVTSLSGAALDGDSNIAPGGDFTRTLGLGTKLSYLDPTGDTVALTLKKGGLIELSLPSTGDPTVRLMGAAGGTSSLTGTVKKPKTGASDGRATIAAIAGTSGVNTTGLVRCSPAVTTNCMTIGSVSAMVVDAILESRTDL